MKIVDASPADLPQRRVAATKAIAEGVTKEPSASPEAIADRATGARSATAGGSR